MSSTNRSDIRDFHISDYYVTPEDTIRELVENLPLEIFNKLGSTITYILDPCAGGNEENELSFASPMSYPEYMSKHIPGLSFRSMDIREDSLAKEKMNFFDYNPTSDQGEPDMIISNPPFSHAIDFINHSLEIVKPGGYVIFLLRLNFYGSKERKPFWNQFMPKYTLVHSKRIKFLQNMKDKKLRGNTDSIEYAHFIWQQGHYPKYSQLIVI